jgi:hypothetical protein
MGSRWRFSAPREAAGLAGHPRSQLPKGKCHRCIGKPFNSFRPMPAHSQDGSGDSFASRDDLFALAIDLSTFRHVRRWRR